MGCLAQGNWLQAKPEFRNLRWIAETKEASINWHDSN